MVPSRSSVGCGGATRAGRSEPAPPDTARDADPEAVSANQEIRHFRLLVSVIERQGGSLEVVHLDRVGTDCVVA